MGEPVEHLIKEYQEMQENEAEKLELATMAIFITGKDDPLHPPKDIMMTLKGVLNELPLVGTAVAMFFGLIYTLKLKNLKRLKSNFEVMQKVLFYGVSTVKTLDHFIRGCTYMATFSLQYLQMWWPKFGNCQHHIRK